MGAPETRPGTQGPSLRKDVSQEMVSQSIHKISWSSLSVFLQWPLVDTGSVFCPIFRHKLERHLLIEVILEGIRKDPYHIPLQFERLGSRGAGALSHQKFATDMAFSSTRTNVLNHYLSDWIISIVIET